MGYQDKSTDSYSDIANISGLKYDSIVKCFRDPAGVGALIMLKICRVLHIPFDKGYDEWLRVHLEKKKAACERKWAAALKELEKE